jgi:hypothetical protein
MANALVFASNPHRPPQHTTIEKRLNFLIDAAPFYMDSGCFFTVLEDPLGHLRMAA